MMTIIHVPLGDPQPIMLRVGDPASVLLWSYGVVIGRIAAIQLLPAGGLDVVVEYDPPAADVVPDDLCARVEACRFDPVCPFADSCARHVHGGDCGGCDQ